MGLGYAGLGELQATRLPSFTIQFMSLYAIVFCIALTACGPSRTSVPRSICDTTPESISKSADSSIRWQGLLINATPHGIIFVGECKQRRGIRIVDFPDGPMAGELVGASQQTMFKPGVLRVDLTRTIVKQRGLIVTQVHGFTFQAMTENQDRQFKDSIGL